MEIIWKDYNLKELTISEKRDFDLAGILRHTPNLENLTLCYNSTDLLAAVEHTPHLKHIDLLGCEDYFQNLPAGTLTALRDKFPDATIIDGKGIEFPKRQLSQVEMLQKREEVAKASADIIGR